MNTEYKEDWAKRLNGFLEFNGNEILTDAGKISAEKAKLHAETEFEKCLCLTTINFISDIDIKKGKDTMTALFKQELKRNKFWSLDKRI